MKNFIWLCSLIQISAYFPMMGYHACALTHQTARRHVTVTPRISALSYKTAAGAFGWYDFPHPRKHSCSENIQLVGNCK